MPADLEGLPQPLIGYYGAIAPWFDLAAVGNLLSVRTDLHLVLIGPVEHGFPLKSLTRFSNAHYLGPKPYADLPAYLHRFSIALIPFAMSPLIEKVNPTKLYEYLAAGKSVVSAPLPEVVVHEPIVTIYRSPGALVTAIDDALKADSASLQERRRQIALASTWDALADRMATSMARLS